MQDDLHRKPLLDMTLDGHFRTPPASAPGGAMGPVVTKIAIAAAIVALVAGAGAIAAFALWVVAVLLPVAVVAGLVAAAAIRFQLWRIRK